MNVCDTPGTLPVRCRDVIEEGVAPFCRWGKQVPGRLNKLLLGGRDRRTDSWARFLNISLSRVILVVIVLETGMDGSLFPISQKTDV